MIVALVVAHSRSKGLPGKTLKTLGGRTLLDIAIDKALAADLPVVVCTDYEVEREDVFYIARDLGQASPTKAKWDVWRYIARHTEYIRDNQVNRWRAFVDIDVTRPLTTAEDVRGIVAEYTEAPIAAVCEAKKNPFFDTFHLYAGALAPAKGHKLPSPGARQTVPPAYEYGGLYVCSLADLNRYEGMWEAQPVPYLIPRARCFDVDDALDWQVVQDQWARQREPVPV